jgi:transcriptional regulator with XRE-family HTH domain
MNAEADPDRDTEAKELGERLKTAREYLNFSQQYVAEHTGIPRTAISDMERGVRRVDSLALRKIARLFQMPPGYFLDPEVGADVGEHSVALLARRIMSLQPEDVEAVEEFVTFMALRRSARADASGTESVPKGDL